MYAEDAYETLFKSWQLDNAFNIFLLYLFAFKRVEILSTNPWFLYDNLELCIAYWYNYLFFQVPDYLIYQEFEKSH